MKKSPSPDECRAVFGLLKESVWGGRDRAGEELALRVVNLGLIPGPL